MSSEFFGFDTSFLYETSSPAQDHLFLETAREIQDSSSLLINESSSWEQIASQLDAAMEVKREECQPRFGSSFSITSDADFMHMNYCQLFPFGPQFDRVWESKNSRNQFLGSPESIGSNGDLQKEKPPFSSEKSLMEEANFKVGKYSKEERKWRIDRYRAKRTRRNFNKTIKYACRKTLADGRQRIRGRFARKDDAGEASLFQDKYDLWIDDWMVSRRRS